MQIFLTIIFILCHIITLSQSDSIIKENYKSAELKNENSNIRKLPIFPKKTMKFVVTPSPYIHRVYSHKPKQKIMPKISLVPQTTLKPKLKNSETTTKIIKPLLKFRTFTIKTYANGKFDEIRRNSQFNLYDDTTPKNEIGVKERDVTIAEKEIVTEIYPPEDRQIVEKNIIYFSKPNDKTLGNEVNELRNIKDDVLFEAEQDRNEFIFLEEENSNGNLEKNYEEFHTSAETTMQFEMTEKPKRIKRSVIEEENMASTVSGLKFTVRDTKLNNNFYFRNINS